ncbi:hypothetical protein RRF57_000691 [Xylaria bambusicola]|uniref:Uncharacterized protein n=1 Tax=Xylaria bambusicola TaxID=326684 RepID=A0AAN7U3Y6_9PEZI
MAYFKATQDVAGQRLTDREPIREFSVTNGKLWLSRKRRKQIVLFTWCHGEGFSHYVLENNLIYEVILGNTVNKDSSEDWMACYYSSPCGDDAVGINPRAIARLHLPDDVSLIMARVLGLA